MGLCIYNALANSITAVQVVLCPVLIISYPLNVAGTGVSENGFDFAQGHSLNFFFTVPKQKDANTIHKAELWVFPHVQSTEPGNVINLEILIIASLSHAKKNRHLIVKYPWRTEEGCIPLDVTLLARRISNSLTSKGLNETNVTVKLEVVKAATRLARPGEGGSGDLLPLCNALQTRTNNNPFMIMKYYDEPETTTDEVLLSKRQVPNMSTGRQESNCTLTSLVVSLKEVYGTFLVAPQIADIKNCQGGCTFGRYQSFSSHALVKDRLNWMSGGEHPRGLSVSCVPTELSPLELLIYERGYFIIVEFPDMVAEKCACR